MAMSDDWLDKGRLKKKGRDKIWLWGIKTEYILRSSNVTESPSRWEEERELKRQDEKCGFTYFKFRAKQTFNESLVGS